MAHVFDPGSRRTTRPFGTATPSPRLFNAATPGRRKRRRAALFLIGTVMAAVVTAVFWFGSSGDDQWWATIPGLAAVGLGCGAVLSTLFRQTPTVACAGCGALGWAEDVRAYGGRCPHCGTGRFRADGRRHAGVAMASGIEVSGDDICSGDFCVDGDSPGRDSGGDGGGDSGGDGGGGDGGGGD